MYLDFSMIFPNFVNGIIIKWIMEKDRIVALIKDSLLQNLPPNGHAMLFGSRARGDNRADSDWDILVVLDKDRLTANDYDSITYPLTQLGWDIDEQINPVMYSKKDWEKYNYTPFYMNVVNDAIVLI